MSKNRITPKSSATDKKISFPNLPNGKSKSSKNSLEQKESAVNEKVSSRRNSQQSEEQEVISPKASSEDAPRGPKYNKLHPESLFLLEFLVEKLMVYPKSLPVQLRNESGGICVDLLLFDTEPLEICQEEFNPLFGCPNPYNRSRSGRSLLFALEPKIVNEIMKEFQLNLEVFKLVESKEEGRVKVGEVLVDISQEFSDVINRIYREGTKNPITTTQIYNSSIVGTLANSGCCIGEINLLMRVSCLGKTIVTQIHMSKDDDSVLFADDKMTSMYKFTEQNGGSSRKNCSRMTFRSGSSCKSFPCIPTPCNFPRGFALCGPNPVCAPMCGMPVGSTVCYIPPCYNPCYLPCSSLMEVGGSIGKPKEIIPTNYKKDTTKTTKNTKKTKKKK